MASFDRLLENVGTRTTQPNDFLAKALSGVGHQTVVALAPLFIECG
jgi:hypothetical protein